MSTIENRLNRLEQRNGATPWERYLNLLSEEQLDARIAQLTARLRDELHEKGTECDHLIDAECVQLARTLWPEDWPKPGEPMRGEPPR